MSGPVGRFKTGKLGGKLMMKNILVICRTNSVMSPIVEAVLNAQSAGVWRAFSAGSEPAERINPYTFLALKSAGIPLKASQSTGNWRTFCGPDAPRFEIVLTVSEDVAWEEMPVWNGVPRLMHWAMPDPLVIACSPSERLGLVNAWCDLARARVAAFLLEERHAPGVEPIANDNGGVAQRVVGT